MLKQMVLKTEGFHFSFDVDYAQTGPQYCGMVVTFRLLPPLPELEASSEETSIAIDDLRRLQEYFEQHMAKLLATDGNVEADVFVNWELGFQIQALVGEAESPTDGTFSIRCQVNAGKSENGYRTYVGGESNLTFEQARAFIRDIQTFIDELPGSTQAV